MSERAKKFYVKPIHIIVYEHHMLREYSYVIGAGFMWPGRPAPDPWGLYSSTTGRIFELEIFVAATAAQPGCAAVAAIKAREEKMA